jgi:hypothetical protein
MGEKVMKYIFIFILSLMQMCSMNSSDNAIYPIYENGRYSYINSCVRKIDGSTFEEANYFYEGLAVVKKNGKYGAVNSKGNIVIPFEYEKLGNFSSDRAYASLDGIHYGYIDSKNNCVIDFIYKDGQGGFEPRSFSEGYAITSKGEFDYFYVIDIDGNEILKRRTSEGLDYVGDFSEGLLQYYRTYIDADFGKTGEYVINEKYTLQDYNQIAHYPSAFSCGRAVYYFPYDVNAGEDLFRTEFWYKSYIDHNGDVITDRKFEEADMFSENLAVVKLDGKTGVIDTNGEFVFYNDDLSFGEYYHNGLIAYEDKQIKKYGFLDTEGNIVIPPEFDDVYMGFVYELALVNIGNDMAYIDKKGEVVFNFEYSQELQYKAEEVNDNSIYDD